MARVAVFLVLASVLSAQEARQTASAGDELSRHLADLDAKIYCASAAGLRAVSFTYRPGADTTSRAGFRVRYFWRAGVGDRVEFIDKEGKVDPLPPLPEKYREQMRGFYLGTSRRLGDILRGRTFADRYRTFRGRVVRQVVNRREEVTLVLEPRSPKRIRRIKVRLDRRGLPLHWEIDYLNGDKRDEKRKYEQRDAQWVMTSRQERVTPGTPSRKGTAQAFVATYQKIGGYYLLSTIRKAVPGVAPGVKGTTEIKEVLVDGDVPAFTPVK